MKFIRSKLMFAAAVAVLAAPSFAGAQEWPTRPVRIIVPNAAGGTSDIAARLAAEHFSNVFKQPFVVENRPGAGGIIGMQGIITAPPDGYTIGVTTVSTLALVPVINPKASYKPLTDFTHLGYMVGSPVALSMAPATNVKTLAEFVGYAEKAGKALTFASSGVGSDGHLIGEAIGAQMKIKVEHVPYRVTTQALQDVVGSHVTFATFTLSSASSFIRAGTLKAVAITASERMADFPDVPTFKELGYPGLVSSTWFAMAGPPNLPTEIVEKINRELRSAMAKPEVDKLFRQSGMQTLPLTAPQFTKFVEEEIGRWRPLIEANKLVGAGE